MDNIWSAIIIAIITSTLSPAILLMLKSRSERQQRIDDAKFRQQEREAIEAREDAREARADSQRALMIKGLDIVKSQTDGVLDQVAALARSTGHAEATAQAQDTAATLALGQQQGRASERESRAGGSSLGAKSDSEVPVTDSRVAKATEQIAAATEREASAKERIADVAEDKNPADAAARSKPKE